MKREHLAVLFVAVVLAAGTVSLFFSNKSDNSPTVTAPSVPGYHVIATDSNSKIGIDLILALNSTTIKQGQDLQTVVEVLNTLPQVNDVIVAADFPVKPLVAKCLPGDYTPTVIQMYSGYYDRTNISSATPLTYELSCPPVGTNSITTEYYYLFEPNSANATLYGRTTSGNFSNAGLMSLREVNQISLYQFNFSFPNYTFPVGTYTLMVEDFWGQMVILHFSVVS